MSEQPPTDQPAHWDDEPAGDPIAPAPGDDPGYPEIDPGAPVGRGAGGQTGCRLEQKEAGGP